MKVMLDGGAVRHHVGREFRQVFVVEEPERQLLDVFRGTGTGFVALIDRDMGANPLKI
jgi:hypothetical protein